jgi:hypothetical protein
MVSPQFSGDVRAWLLASRPMDSWASRSERDLAALVVPRPGSVVAMDDPLEPYRLLAGLDRTRRNGRAHAHHNPMEPFRNERAGLYPRAYGQLDPVTAGQTYIVGLSAKNPGTRFRKLNAVAVLTGPSLPVPHVGHHGIFSALHELLGFAVVLRSCHWSSRCPDWSDSRSRARHCISLRAPSACQCASVV